MASCGLALGVATVQLAVADDAFGLGADVDEDLVLVDPDDGALDDVTVLEALDVRVLLGEELLHRRRLGAEVARRARARAPRLVAGGGRIGGVVVAQRVGGGRGGRRVGSGAVALGGAVVGASVAARRGSARRRRGLGGAALARLGGARGDGLVGGDRLGGLPRCRPASSVAAVAVGDRPRTVSAAAAALGAVGVGGCVVVRGSASVGSAVAGSSATATAATDRFGRLVGFRGDRLRLRRGPALLFFGQVSCLSCSSKSPDMTTAWAAPRPGPKR